MVEEKEERELRITEENLKKTQQRLENGESENNERIWFQKASASGIFRAI